MPDGQRITLLSNGTLGVPHRPIIPFIEGDGIGSDVWRATRLVLDAAVEAAYGTQRAIHWHQLLAGEQAFEKTGEWLPDETLEAIRDHHVAIKGPLTTPVGGGIRSLNVAMRQRLGLYACIRPVKWFEGVPSPMRSPQDVDVVIFRENTEDVYAGIEWEAEADETVALIGFLSGVLDRDIPEDSGIGFKPMSKEATRRIVRKALRYAVEHGRQRVTLVHKGNIMKYTEGAFQRWGYELAAEEFGTVVVTEDELSEVSDGSIPPGKILLNDRIADAMFQQLLLRPSEYDVLVAPNLNGDYLSDAAAAQVGGLGMAPGANIGDGVAVFEATHGTAPKHAGKNRANPSSLILSGELLLRHIGWDEAADLVVQGVLTAIARKTVTYDLHRQMEGATKRSTTEFATDVIAGMSTPVHV